VSRCRRAAAQARNLDSTGGSLLECGMQAQATVVLAGPGGLPVAAILDSQRVAIHGALYPGVAGLVAASKVAAYGYK